MCLSSYCKTIHHIYFNYHFGESTSRWINSKFTRHFQFALRMFIGFCLSAFIAYGTRLRDRLTLKFMIPGMTILSIKETFAQLKTSLLNLSTCQSLFISSLIPHSSITRHELLNNLTNLQLSYDRVRSSYIETRLNLIKDRFQSSKIIQSEDHLSHSFFLFQLCSIVRLLTKSTLINRDNKINKRKSFKNCFKGDWSRFVTALKTTIIIGIGSIFVMIPNLAKKFENGQWILIALCMTQGDTVGGAFTTIKMRLIGTLFGAMWAYITYLSAGNDIFKTIIMLSPWMFFCGYMKLYPQWGY
ncbi:unnamed protein product, partial [Rotaria sp. Silwood2]